MRNAALHARFGAATATRGTAVECSEGDDKDEFVTPSKRSADDPKATDHAVQSSLEFETPAKGPKQVPKLLPRPAGARPGVQKPPTAEDELPMKEVLGDKVEVAPGYSDECRGCRLARRLPDLFAGRPCHICGKVAPKVGSAHYDPIPLLSCRDLGDPLPTLHGDLAV